ncbi:MAG: hypothetical protein FWD84_07265 [Oscillospiraceae bacterium]|nr:hypothetical protein [Oscillospiraceae bacterium]
MTEMILVASLMIVVGVLLRLFLIHRLSKLLFIVIWGLVSLRLLVPFSLPETFRVLNLAALPLPELDTLPPVVTHVFETISTQGQQLASPAIPSGVDWPLTLGILWVLGSALLAAYFLATHLRFRQNMRTSLPTEHAYITNWLAAKKRFRTIRVRQSDKIRSPLTFGVFHPVILLPAALDMANEDRLNYILTHEYTHVKRFDYVWKLVFAAVLCVHWFNPLVWLMYMLANRDIELSCDETVLRICGPKSKAAYGLTLLDLADGKTRTSFAYSHFSRHSLDERICALARTGRRSMVGTVTALALVLGAMTVFVHVADAPMQLVSCGASWAHTAFHIPPVSPAPADPIATPINPIETQPTEDEPAPRIHTTQVRWVEPSVCPEEPYDQAYLDTGLLERLAVIDTCLPSVEWWPPFECPLCEWCLLFEWWPPFDPCSPFTRPPVDEYAPFEPTPEQEGWPPCERPPFFEYPYFMCPSCDGLSSEYPPEACLHLVTDAQIRTAQSRSL